MGSLDLFFLKQSFQKKVFEKVIHKFGSSFKAEKALGIPAVSIRAYKNLNTRSIHLTVIQKLIKNKFLTRKELKENTLTIKNKKKIVCDCLNSGRIKRINQLKKWKEEVPSLKEIFNKKEINFEKWFEHYQKLINFGARKFNWIHLEEDYLEVSYITHSNDQKKDFILKFPRRIIIDDEFLYFFGLWCGDRAGGKRWGVINKNNEIINFTDFFLKKNYQKVEKILYISKNLDEPKIKYDKKVEINRESNGWALSVHSINGIFSSFYESIISELDYFLDNLDNLYCFFAGLFDAEGNVSLYNKSFRWACKNEKRVKIYSKFLKKLGLYSSYDGGCLVTYNLKIFFEKIFPYLKHSKKIRLVSFLCGGKGEIPAELKRVLDHIYKFPLSTQKDIAKALKKRKVYSELGWLRKFGFILAESYPLRFKINNENKN